MKIKNWSKFQHFKDRRPPWIKLYRDILDDKQWHALDGDAAKLLVNIWLLASEDEGNIAAPDELAFRLRVTDKHINQCLPRLAHWLEQPDINPISTRYQSGSVADTPNSVADVSVYLETETETERKKEKEKEKEKEIQAPEGVSAQVWQDFKKSRKTLRAAITQSAIDGIKREADKAGWTLENALTECCARGWRGFKADWVDEAKQIKNSYLPPQPSQTVPSKPGIDPALAKIISDQLSTKPPSDEIRARMKQITGERA